MLTCKRTSILYTILAITLWSFTATGLVALKSIPSFHLTATILVLAFLSSAVRITYQKRWHALKQPLPVWVKGGLCFGGFNLCYFSSFKFAPPVLVDLINYLWPMMLVFFSPERLRLNQYLSIILAFSGIAVLMSEEFTFEMNYIAGCVLAFVGALCWTYYSLYSRSEKCDHENMVGIHCGTVGLAFLVLHALFEQTVIPTMNQGIILIVVGCIICGCSFYFWNLGIKTTSLSLLSVLSYITPILSVFFLILCKQAELTTHVLLATSLVAIAIFFTQSKYRLFSKSPE